MRSERFFLSCLIVSVCCRMTSLWAQSVPNPSFETGEVVPDGWHLSGGEGGVTDDAAEGSRAVYVTGVPHSQSSNAWYTNPMVFEPGRVYQLSFQAKRVGGSGGSPISGPAFCNRDLYEVTSEWKRYFSYFMAPVSPLDSRLRFGQWEADGVIAFDDIALVPVEPVYRRRGLIKLGDAENIEGNVYTFTAPLDSPACNFARPLREHACQFNKPRWVFARNSEVIYAHQVGGEAQVSAEVEITIGYYVEGTLAVEACRPGEEAWVAIGTLTGEGTLRAALPETLFPAEEVTVRLRGVSSPENPDGTVNLQVYGYAYRAVLDRAPGDLQGETRFVAVMEPDERVQMAFHGFENPDGGGAEKLCFSAANLTETSLSVEPYLVLSSGATGSENARLATAQLPPVSADSTPVAVDMELSCAPLGAGETTLSFALGGVTRYRAETTLNVSILNEARYGYTLPDDSDEVNLWWASSGWKVSRTRPAPREKKDAVRIRVARNEREAAQFVLRPSRPLQALQVSPRPLEGASGAVLPAEAVEVLRVGYVPVSQPTDSVGVAGAWPDPLPPLKGTLDLAANENQPFWVRIRAAADTPAGEYRGSIRLEAGEWHAEVPLEVEVFDFTLPDRSTCVSAFGFDPGLAFQYHNVSDEADRRAVFEKYLALLGDHHISIYNPAVLDPIVYSWPHLPLWQGGQRAVSPEDGENTCLLLRDDSETEGVSSLYDKKLPVSEKGIRVAFTYKTGVPGHEFIITILHHDDTGNWMPGKNRDIVITGDGSWQPYEVVIGNFPEGASQYQLRLWATRYAEDGHYTGEVWFDGVQVTDVASGASLISERFTPPDKEALEVMFTPEFDWTNWDAAMTRAFEKYGFNSFSLPVPGMGGGTFHERWEPELLGHREGTPEYEIAFTAWCRAAEAHLREKGWLDESFIYWFDEPEPDDYAFVMNGFRKLKEAAPGLNRMLTEEVTPELIGGPNIWCPVSFNYDYEKARRRQAEGETIWWYICTGPKQPYATLFIDHPGTELRVWLWQTWERSIEGILIWQSNYWTSEAAYPDAPQNPYKDPMGWVSGYSTPAGARRPWGNGDGRFLYPPEAAADGRPDGPVFDVPVGSIRLDMLRDGIEDYEYFVILRGLVEAFEKNHSESEARLYRALLEVPDTVSTSLTEFTWDPAPLEAHREAVARAIMQLGSAIN